MKLRNLLWQIPLLVLLTMPLWWGKAAEFLTISKHLARAYAPTDTSLEMQTVVLLQSNNGQTDLLLHASRMYTKEDQRLIYIENANARVGDPAKPVKITSGQALYDTATDIMTLMDEVRVVTANNYILTTPVMRYLTKFRKAKSAAAVDVQGEGMKITGTSFLYDLNNGDFRVGSRVHFDLW